MSRKQQKGNSRMLEVATLGGGCFWCTEAVFSIVRGVMKIEPGYSGGRTVNPTYEQVSKGTTGHAEVVQIIFDPSVISFREILEIFFTTHDPTELNRQGSDVGTQYRSVVFYHNDEQKAAAIELIEKLKKVYQASIVTLVEPFKIFYRAENYHKGYFKNNPGQPYCRAVISPKIAKLRKHYRERLK